MRTKYYHLFLLGFAAVSVGFLAGFKSSDVRDALLIEKRAAPVNVREVRFIKESSVKSRRKQAKDKRLASVANKDAELQKSLDLSIPFSGTENAWLIKEQNNAARMESANMFAGERKKKLRPVDLDGQMLMSQEPEMDKRKSLDGAAIVINLKR